MNDLHKKSYTKEMTATTSLTEERVWKIIREEILKQEKQIKKMAEEEILKYMKNLPLPLV